MKEKHLNNEPNQWCNQSVFWICVWAPTNSVCALDGLSDGSSSLMDLRINCFSFSFHGNRTQTIYPLFSMMRRPSPLPTYRAFPAPKPLQRFSEPHFIQSQSKSNERQERERERRETTLIILFAADTQTPDLSRSSPPASPPPNRLILLSSDVVTLFPLPPSLAKTMS